MSNCFYLILIIILCSCASYDRIYKYQVEKKELSKYKKNSLLIRLDSNDPNDINFLLTKILVKNGYRVIELKKDKEEIKDELLLGKVSPYSPLDLIIEVKINSRMDYDSCRERERCNIRLFNYLLLTKTYSSRKVVYVANGEIRQFTDSLSYKYFSETIVNDIFKNHFENHHVTSVPFEKYKRNEYNTGLQNSLSSKKEGLSFLDGLAKKNDINLNKNMLNMCAVAYLYGDFDLAKSYFVKVGAIKDSEAFGWYNDRLNKR